MKSHIIIKDKKITIYIGIMLTMILYMFVHTANTNYSPFRLIQDMLKTATYNNGGLVLTLAGVVLAYALMTNLITFIFTDEDKIRKGLLIPKIAFYNEIKSIETDSRHIVIKYADKQMKINTHGLEANKEKFSNMLACILNGTNQDKTAEQLISELSKKRNEEYKEESIKLGGWLIVILVYFVLSSWYTTYLLARFIGHKSIYEQLALPAFIFVNIYIIGTIVVRRKKYINHIHTFLWIDFALKCLFVFTSGLIYLLIFDDYARFKDYFNFAIAAGAHVMLLLSIIRYMKISKRVKMTFLK